MPFSTALKDGDTDCSIETVDGISNYLRKAEGRLAITEVWRERIDEEKRRAYYIAKLHTGRTHQVRILLFVGVVIITTKDA